MKIQPLQFIDVSKQFERCFEDRCTLQGCAWVYFNLFTGRMKPIIHSSVPLTDRLNGFRWNGIKHVIGTNIILYYRNTMQYFKRKVNHHVRGKNFPILKRLQRLSHYLPYREQPTSQNVQCLFSKVQSTSQMVFKYFPCTLPFAMSFDHVD